jgi:methyl coenzyme M reductase subunit D
MGKFFEKIIDTRIKNIIEGQNLLTQNQFGFRRGRSTTDVIQKIINITKETITGRNIAGILLLDVKNAFNTAPWNAMSTDGKGYTEIPIPISR